MEKIFSLRQRASGILLHPTSLPGPYGIGDLGPGAWRFAEFLSAGRQRWWQMLPITPPAAGNSPYTSYSAFAGNPALLSPDRLAQDGLLGPDDLKEGRVRETQRVNFAAARKSKAILLEKAFEAFNRRADAQELSRFDAYCSAHAAWLEDCALFFAIKEDRRGEAWTQWEPELRRREPAALQKAAEKLARRILYHKFLQYKFHGQWTALREHCRKLGVGLMGDVPIYAAHDSAEVWARQDMFFLDPDGRPTVVAGVPPDYFTEKGQLWGNPLYRWDIHRDRGFDWWIGRMRGIFERFDSVRLDHFIGFRRYWEVPADHKTAQHGRWIDGPGEALFDKVLQVLGPLELVAEDLGEVTPEVHALRDRFGFPGMRVLQFAFAGDPKRNLHLPHNHSRPCVAYTGTHDNDTSAGWLAKAGPQERAFLRKYLGPGRGAFHRQFLRLAWMSVADTAIAPAQDLLGLGTQARMNLPGTADGNWEWRLASGALSDKIARQLAVMTETYGRNP